MNRINWREIAEVAGVVSIVATLLLVTGELREANRVATTDAKLRLAEAYAAVHAMRIGDPDIAQLFLKIEAPDRHLITATDRSRMQALAEHLGGVYQSIQLAYDEGLLDENDVARYAGDVARSVAAWPGLHDDLVAVYRSLPDVENAAVFAPIAALAAEKKRDASGPRASHAAPDN